MMPAPMPSETVTTTTFAHDPVEPHGCQHASVRGVIHLDFGGAGPARGCHSPPISDSRNTSRSEPPHSTGQTDADPFHFFHARNKQPEYVHDALNCNSRVGMGGHHFLGTFHLHPPGRRWCCEAEYPPDDYSIVVQAEKRRTASPRWPAGPSITQFPPINSSTINEIVLRCRPDTRASSAREIWLAGANHIENRAAVMANPFAGGQL